MKTLIAAALLAACLTTANAAPWAQDTEGAAFIAYQWSEETENALLGYECDAYIGADAFYVQTGERYEPTTDYAPEVPTTLTIDGRPFEITGVFQDRGGYLFTYYDSLEIDGFTKVFDAMVDARELVRVAFYDKALSFSPDGIGDALWSASESCW